MKKSMFFIGIFMLVAAAATSQHISFVASWGSYQPWNVPAYVSDVVYHRYNNYDWVHTRKVVRNGQLGYKVLLQHGPQFMEVTMNRFGHVRRVRHYDYYPLNNHVCAATCGYHEHYFNSFVQSGHYYGNSVGYYSRPVNYTWGHYYNGPTYVKVYNKKHYKHQNHGQKHHVHKQKKNHNKKSTYHDDRYRRPDPIVVKQRAPQRRQGTMKELEEDRRRRAKEGSRSGERTTRSRRVE